MSELITNPMESAAISAQAGSRADPTDTQRLDFVIQHFELGPDDLDADQALSFRQAIDARMASQAEAAESATTYNPVAINVTQQGAVRVNQGHVRRAASGIVCIEVDLHSKYADVLATSGGEGEDPSIVLVARDRSLHLHPNTLSTR